MHRVVETLSPANRQRMTQPTISDVSLFPGSLTSCFFGRIGSGFRVSKPTSLQPPPSRAAGVPPRATLNHRAAAKALPPGCAAQGQRLQNNTHPIGSQCKGCRSLLASLPPRWGTRWPQVAIGGRKQRAPASANPIASPTLPRHRQPKNILARPIPTQGKSLPPFGGRAASATASKAPNAMAAQQWLCTYSAVCRCRPAWLTQLPCCPCRKPCARPCTSPSGRRPCVGSPRDCGTGFAPRASDGRCCPTLAAVVRTEPRISGKAQCTKARARVIVVRGSSA